jgi:hypothetical protein
MSKNVYIRPRAESHEMKSAPMHAMSKVRGYAIDNYDADPEKVINFAEDETGDNEFLDLD